MRIIIDKSTRSNRRNWKWTVRNELRSKDVLMVANERQQYWPMTLRAIYYQIISPGICNHKHWQWNGKTVNIYNALKTLVKWMRIHDRLPWEAITDSYRFMHYSPRFENAKQFVETEQNGFLVGYSRCVAQNQPRHIEIWIEKNTLAHIVMPIGEKYCRPVIVCRGYNSVSFQTDFYERASDALYRGQIPTVLYLGDWDPSGENMIIAAAQTIQDELGLDGIEYYRIGVNPEHFNIMPSDPVPLKPTDARAKKFIEKNGKTCFELDALHPEQLIGIVEKNVQKFTNMEEAIRQERQGSVDEENIEKLRKKINPIIESHIKKFDRG
jgi:hypothetical protein